MATCVCGSMGEAGPVEAQKAIAPRSARWGRGGQRAIADPLDATANDPASAELGPYVPIFDPAHIEALRNAGRRLSPRHWALVVILTKTGMELEAVGRLTWRDVYPDKVYWKPSKSQQPVAFSVEDEELAYALQIFVTGQRKSSDMLDYWIKQIREGTRNHELHRVTGITLRLTYAAALLRAGKTAEAVAKDLRLPHPAVLAVVQAMKAQGIADGHPTP